MAERTGLLGRQSQPFDLWAVLDAPLDRDEVPVSTRWHPLRTQGLSFCSDRLIGTSKQAMRGKWTKTATAFVLIFLAETKNASAIGVVCHTVQNPPEKHETGGIRHADR